MKIGITYDLRANIFARATEKKPPLNSTALKLSMPSMTLCAGSVT